jgi:hypothetical protein
MRRTGVRLALLILLASGFAPGQKKGEITYSLVAGTVFRADGRALPGADVRLEATGTVPKTHRKFKKSSYITDSRGEFAIRVPAEKAEYKLIFSASGYQSQEKIVSIAGEDRVDVFVKMESASK